MRIRMALCPACAGACLEGFLARVRAVPAPLLVAILEEPFMHRLEADLGL
jgi:hypothetical protein